MTYTELTDTGRADWLQLRHAGIGASEIAAVMGRSPWSSPFDLHWKKRGPVPAEETGDEYINWGHKLEPIIVGHFADEHPEFHVRSKVGICVNDNRDWQRATPDALLTEASAWRDRPTHLLGQPRPEPVAGLEVKNAHNRSAWDDDAFQGVPQHYYDQVQWSMDVTGLPVWWVAVLFGGNTYAEYEIGYDEAYAAELRTAGEKFWSDVQTGDAPPLDAHDATRTRLLTLHPDVEDIEVEVLYDLAERYRHDCEAAKRADERKRQTENEVRAAVGDGRYAVTADGDRVATRSVSEVTRIDSKKLKAAYPQIADECSTTTTVHRLTPARRNA